MTDIEPGYGRFYDIGQFLTAVCNYAYIRYVSAYSSNVNSARASYLRRESHSGANTRVLRCYDNVLIIIRLCSPVGRCGFSDVAKRAFLHCERASSAPPKSLSCGAAGAFLSLGTGFSVWHESAEEPFPALSPGRGGIFMPFSYAQ